MLDSEGLVSLGDTLRIKQSKKGARTHKFTLQAEPVPPPVDVPDSVEKITDLRIVRAVTEEDRRKWRRLFLRDAGARPQRQNWASATMQSFGVFSSFGTYSSHHVSCRSATRQTFGVRRASGTNSRHVLLPCRSTGKAPPPSIKEGGASFQAPPSLKEPLPLSGVAPQDAEGGSASRAPSSRCA